MKLEFSQQIFLKYLNIEFCENPSSGSRVVPCGRTDMTTLIVAFSNFAKELKTYNDLRSELKAVLPLANVSRPTNVDYYLTILIITTVASTLISFIFAKELTYTLYTC
jgi:hypothetical protein